jgi:hypothetical protein
MTTRTLVLAGLLITASASAMAQPAPQAPRAATPEAPRPRAGTPDQPAPPQPQPPAPRRQGQAINVKVEFTIADQRGGGAAVKRTISIIVADGQVGQIRSQSDVFGINGGVPLNVDTIPELLTDGKIRLGFNLQYDWAAPVEPGERGTPRGTVLKTAMHDSVSLILESGKSMVAAQSADPIGDRQVTVEVKATVLR